MPSEPFILVFLHQRMRNQRIAKVDWKLMGCGVRLGKRVRVTGYKLWEMATLVPQCDRCVCTVSPFGLTMLVLED
ncbi:hypothetical protein Tco_0911448 [Tanacetum coccineum]|uniref:Uncharacterized protein n=1 Tax=Tanacetum coccineum TaxID=301880 RepID=A0ABQ5CY01_9ASTR